MRFALVATFVASLLVMGGVSAQQMAPVEASAWIVWADDADFPEYPVTDGAIETVRVAASSSYLHIELNTAKGAAESPTPASRLEFETDQDNRTRRVSFEWADEPMLAVDGESSAAGWQVSAESTALQYHLQISWTTLGIGATERFSLDSLFAATSAIGITTDTATGDRLPFEPSPGGPILASPSIDYDHTIEGPDYAGGASITTNNEGTALVAYYIYDGDRGTAPGIYLAEARAGASGIKAEFVAATEITRDNGRDGQMRTQIAYDGTQPFILFTSDPAVDNDPDGVGHLGTPDSVFVAHRVDGDWILEDPTPGGKSDVAAEDVSDLVARDGRVVAAVPVGEDVWIVERHGADDWQRVATLADANNAKIALDSAGIIHAAWVHYPAPSMRGGHLFYGASSNNFEATQFSSGITAGWEEPETDGSFAIAAGPSDEVALLWNDEDARDRDREQILALLKDDQWQQEYAPLTASHGNPQYTMRVAFDAYGMLYAASGYGGTDSLAVRAPYGEWAQTNLDRFDVWDMTAMPGGGAIFAYTEPHGGTTLAMSFFGATLPVSPTDGEALDSTPSQRVPGPAIGVLVIGLAAIVRNRR